jgi:hypothetical protein
MNSGHVQGNAIANEGAAAKHEEQEKYLPILSNSLSVGTSPRGFPKLFTMADVVVLIFVPSG